jgi:hypothetical protein
MLALQIAAGIVLAVATIIGAAWLSNQIQNRRRYARWPFRSAR